MSASTPVFALPDHLAAKADPALIGGDEQHFCEVARCLDETTADLSARLDALRRAPGRKGQAALERDQEIRRLTGRLRMLDRFGLDACLGRMVAADGSEPVYVGRVGLTDGSGRRLLIDWRSPAAEPFFGATHADPMGLTSRRRYRWTRGHVTDYWDEVFAADAVDRHAALDDQSAFIASLGGSRSSRMRDVLGTIQADQDAIIRAGSRGALVVDGGPGTGKTVVALHRTAYLLYTDPRLEHRRGGVLFVGPHQPYLSYVSDVLPSLGEDGVQTCTLRDLVPEGATSLPEADPQVAGLKASAGLVGAIDAAVGIYEEPPTEPLLVETPWSEVRLGADDWAEAFAAPEPGTPHNEARDQVWQALVAIALDKHSEEGYDEDGDAVDGEVVLSPELMDRVLRRDRGLVEALHRAWPMIEPTDLVGDLWEVPAYLRLCAPWLTPQEVQRLQRPDPQAWTDADLPLLDAARQRLGDPDASQRRRREEAAAAAASAEMSRVVEELVAAEDDTDLALMHMLKGQDMRRSLVDDELVERPDPDLLAGPFAHVVVDEAQELTDAEWQMLLLRCPSRSFTIVGDRAQARHGFTESWQERLLRVGFDQIGLASLRFNYRTPAEVMTESEPVIRAALPDANVPVSVREVPDAVVRGAVEEAAEIVDTWLATHGEGTVCVVDRGADGTTFGGRPRARWLTPELTKGLEFDLVVLVEPSSYGGGIEGAVDRYVAMTRATQRLVILTSHGTCPVSAAGGTVSR